MTLEKSCEWLQSQLGNLDIFTRSKYLTLANVWVWEFYVFDDNTQNKFLIQIEVAGDLARFHICLNKNTFDLKVFKKDPIPKNILDLFQEFMESIKNSPNFYPTMENVLDEYKQDCYLMQSGNVGMPGLSPCPWCGSHMTYREEGSAYAVCKNNPRHKTKWIPWGG
jgi:hypothetical protein